MAKPRITDYTKIKRLSIDLLSQSDLPQKLVAIGLDSSDRIISIGYNSYTKTHPIQAFYAQKCGMPYKIFLHAEISAIVSANSQIETLIVSRINNFDNLLLAKPCECCMAAIFDAGIKKVIYSTSEDSYDEILI